MVNCDVNKTKLSNFRFCLIFLLENRQVVLPGNNELLRMEIYITSRKRCALNDVRTRLCRPTYNLEY